MALLTLAELFLYFIFYSFVGWCMETAFCSINERKWVARGFLFGPICPIYGVGALLLVAGGRFVSDSPWLLYLVSTVVLSAWEYLVGWFLEVTTKMKYWDYSHHKYHLHGRVSLFISLWWGVLAFLMVYLVHPAVQELFLKFSPLTKQIAAALLLLLTLVDASITVRKLALTRSLMQKLEQISVQVKERLEELPPARESLSSAAETLRERMEELPTPRESWSQAMRSLKERYDRDLAALEKHSRRFRTRYKEYSSVRFRAVLDEMQERVQQLKDKLGKH